MRKNKQDTKEVMDRRRSEGIGVVYTPDFLARFVAHLAQYFAGKLNEKIEFVLDPACGEGALLKAAREVCPEVRFCAGIDIDASVLEQAEQKNVLICSDAILPDEAGGQKTADYWKKKLSSPDLIIANPPWTSLRWHDVRDLECAGLSMYAGQYDVYALFMELSYQILRDNGICAFIIPDSFFDTQNAFLREFFLTRTRILSVCRLGEKIFNNVNRATTVMICQKKRPTQEDLTRCFQLSLAECKRVLRGDSDLYGLYFAESHEVRQARFASNQACRIDINTRREEEVLIQKISSQTGDWHHKLLFSRGVEINKFGDVVICPHCSTAQGIRMKSEKLISRSCKTCGLEFSYGEEDVIRLINPQHEGASCPIYVGEHIRRYEKKGQASILIHIPGIQYKNAELYRGPKILVRKTGLGIYALLDESDAYTSQTVYMLKPSQLYGLEKEEMLFYLAMLNSRVVYYYYLKMYGETEWKSHPYITKTILYSLPIPEFRSSGEDKAIAAIAGALNKRYDADLDVFLERMIMERYGLSEDEKEAIKMEINNLPNLSSVNGMKIQD